MGYSDIIRDSFKSDDRRILHTDAKQSCKNPFRTGSAIKIFFKGVRAIIDLLADLIVNPDVGITSFLREEFGVKDRTDKELFNNFLRMMDWADPFAPPTVLGFIVECAAGQHFYVCLA